MRVCVITLVLSPPRVASLSHEEAHGSSIFVRAYVEGLDACEGRDHTRWIPGRCQPFLNRSET